MHQAGFDDNVQGRMGAEEAKTRFKKWREANPERARAIQLRYRQSHPGGHRVWYSRNRQRVLEKVRARKRARREYVSCEELRECQTDIRRAKTIRGPNVIVCLGSPEGPGNCGQILKSIRPNHLREHGLSTAEYRKRWGYNKGTALISDNLSAALRSRAQQSGNLTPEAGRGYLQPGRRGQIMSREFRLKHSERMRGIRRPDLSKGTSDGEIVRLWLLSGKSISEVGRHVSLSQGAVHKRLQAVFGVYVKQRILFSHGEPVTNLWINKLCERFGRLTKTQLGRLLSISPHYLQDLGARKKNRSITLQLAEKLVTGEQVFFKAMADAPGVQSDYLNATVPDLEVRYRAAVTAFKLIRGVTDDDQKQFEFEMGRLSDASRKEVAGRNGHFRARTALIFLPRVLSWTKENQVRKSLSPGELARLFLAGEYRTKEWIVKASLRSPSPAQSTAAAVRAIILSSVTPPPKRAGRHRGRKDQETLRRIRLAAALSLLNYTKYKMVAPLYPQHHRRPAAENVAKMFLRRNQAAISGQEHVDT